MKSIQKLKQKSISYISDNFVLFLILDIMNGCDIDQKKLNLELFLLISNFYADNYYL